MLLMFLPRCLALGVLAALLATPAIPQENRTGAKPETETKAPSRAAKPAAARKAAPAAQTRQPANLSAQERPQDFRRIRPQEFDRDDDADGGVRPMMTPSGRPGLGGRF
jgi:hypothetical protein